MRYFAFLTKASLRYFEVPLNNYLIYRYSCLNLAALAYSLRNKSMDFVHGLIYNAANNRIPALITC